MLKHEGLRRGQMALRGSATRANGFARVFDEGKMLCEGLRRGQMALRGSSTRVINHEGNERSDFSYLFEKLAECIGFT